VLDPGVSNRLWLACEGAAGSDSWIAGLNSFFVLHGSSGRRLFFSVEQLNFVCTGTS